MTRTHSHNRLAAAFAALLLCIPAAAAAATPDAELKPGHAARAARAAPLHARALVLEQDRWRAAAAALLHMEGVRLRAPDDPDAIPYMIRAAHLYGYGNEPHRARRTMEAAALRALRLGDHATAASAYQAAALFALRTGDARLASALRNLAREAEPASRLAGR
jgi:hypothetical protein